MAKNMPLIGFQQYVHAYAEYLRKAYEFDIRYESLSALDPLHGVFVDVQTQKLTFFR